MTSDPVAAAAGAPSSGAPTDPSGTAVRHRGPAVPGQRAAVGDPDPAPAGGGAGAPGGERLRLLLVGSSGGHLAQLTALDPWSAAHDRHWVCFDTPDAVSILAGESVTWAYHPTTRHLPNLLRNLGLAWRVMRAERPDVVLSTGAGVALPFFVLARLLGVPAVFLEVYDRLDTSTLTGRLVRPFATRMLVQWEEQRGLYRDAEVVGCVL
jgi:UDP-N-acetylglucosamine:LPS N-acetylglucosamine transferase